MCHTLSIKIFAEPQSEVNVSGTDSSMQNVPCRFDVKTIWLGQKTNWYRHIQRFDGCF